jgi:leucyl-tRNA synthetase
MTDGSAEMEKKWQERWYSARINEANPSDRPKFMIIFAYPGVTGYLHVGHMRGFSYVDAIARYKRMMGFNVLFPVGTHATGNGAISLANRVRRGDENTLEYLMSNGCSKENLERLKTPNGVVDFFNEVYVNDYWKRFGFLADWRRFTCTIYPEYGHFIQWQFRKLNDKGLLIQKPYFAPVCVNCGPVAIDASETDLQKGGRAETNEYTLLKFQCGDFYLVAATLRPETVYGQTNFWINPDVEYAKVRLGQETWVISKESMEKMRYQKDGLEIVGTINGKDLVGRKCIAPVIHREILVLPAAFCDPNVGTGLVTSVPSDAPDDWIALKNIQDDPEELAMFGLNADEVRAISPIAIIDTKGWGPMPAVEIIERMGIKRSGDPRLLDAKKEIYKAGFHTGRMNANCGAYAGMPVEKAKDEIKALMIANGEADIFFDLSEEVICRCGGKVVIKKVPDQWFIDYANVPLTTQCKEHAKTMNILPTEYYTNIPGVLDWFRERACVRQGNWLGTKFPFDDKWIIEAISDSTLYPLFYLISHYVRGGQVKEDQLSETVLDYVFLGKGEPDQISKVSGIGHATLKAMRREVEYFYPLDVNLGGKEHMTVHFPAFLKNHVAILEKESWPKGIFVNWYVIGRGGKISKSKGGAQPIPGAAEHFGVDSLRLYYAHIASPFADVEWDEEAIDGYKGRLDRLTKSILELNALQSKEGMETIDRWLLSRVNSRIDVVKQAMEQYDMRNLAGEVYFEMTNDVRWYGRRGGCNGNVAKRAIDIWVRIMAPITPHLAEELWAQMGHDDLVAAAEFPSSRIDETDLHAEQAEEYLKGVLADVNEILKVTGITPKRLSLYTTPAWKLSVWDKAISMAKQKQLTVPALTKSVMADPEIRLKGKEASDFARKMAEELMKRSPEELDKLSLRLEEGEVLTSATPFIAQEVGCAISVYSADDASAPDPHKKARAAQPRRPAIYVE